MDMAERSGSQPPDTVTPGAHIATVTLNGATLPVNSDVEKVTPRHDETGRLQFRLHFPGRDRVLVLTPDDRVTYQP